jgi:DNA-binding beta-propeller fold protein YncE
VLAGTVAGFTLTMTGTNFVPSSVIQWNGSPRPTSFVSGTQLKASIPASDIAAPGAANITAFNPAPGGGTSPALSLLICAVSLKSVSAIATPNYMAWDANRATLYVSVASTDPSIPNTIIPVNPLTATAGTPVPAGNNPHLFSISSDDSYLWVGLDGDNAVQRFLLPALTKDISFKLPIDSANHAEQAVSLEASPFSPHVLAVGSGSWGDSPAAYGGIFIYDDATPRPTFIPGYGSGGPTTDWIQWGPNSSTIYGTSTGTVSTLNVTSSGISLASLNGGQGGPFRGVSHYDRGNGNLYSFGYAYNPANGSLLGKFTVPDERECVSDSTLGRFFCIRSTADPVQVELWVFDLNTYALLARYYLGAPLGQPPAPITGAPFQVLRWGKAGLAVATSTFPYAGNGGLFLLDGLGINPAVPPDFSAVAVASTSYPTVTSLTPSQTTIGSTDVTVTLSGTNFTPDTTVCFVCFLGSNQNFQTTFVNSQQLTFTIPAANLSTAGFLTIGVDDSATNTYGANSLTFAINPQPGGSASTNVTAVQLAGLSVAYDPHSALLYVATADYEPLYPNSIVAIDPTTGSVSKTQTVGSNPDLLSVSANGQFLYMGFASSTSMAQLPLPLPSTELTWALHNPATSAVYWAGNLEAAPQSPHTTALNLLDIQLTPANLGGVVIYDDKALLPNYVQGWGSSTLIFDGLAWGSSDQVLTGASATSPLSELQVNSSGVSVLATGTTDFNSTPGAIHSDFGTGLIYSDSGKVADPATQAVVGNYNASGLLAPDSSLNRVFILGQTSTQQGTNNFTIQSFDQKNYTPVSSLTIDNVLGIPTQLIRCGTSCLALLTNNQGNYGGTQGMVYLIQDSTFVSSKLAAPAAATATSTEFVKLRWKPLTTSDIIKTLRARNQQHPN